jgi:hypothetical protein
LSSVRDSYANTLVQVLITTSRSNNQSAGAPTLQKLHA